MTDRGTIEQQICDTKQGVAILVTCIVQEMEALHPGFTENLGQRLERAYREVLHEDIPAPDRLELINWVREIMLTGWGRITGQGKPFLKH
jgi:hypothetical protein